MATARHERQAPPLLTPAAAAKRTGISVSLIRQALSDGSLAYLQPNGARGWRLIRPEDLEAWVAEITVARRSFGSGKSEPLT